VTNIVADAEKLGQSTDSQYRTNSIILAAGGTFALGAIILIGFITVTKSRRQEADLRQAKDEAEDASRAKSEFLSAMSHELRTPLHSVLGFAQLLESDDEHPLDEIQNDGVQRILKSGYLLRDLINQVLDLARIESGTLSHSIEKVAPDEVISHCLDISRTMADARNIAVIDKTKGSPLPVVMADRMRLQQVLLNLLSNAVKYNREGGTVTLEIRPTSANMLRFSITDTGGGIAEDKREKKTVPAIPAAGNGGRPHRRRRHRTNDHTRTHPSDGRRHRLYQPSGHGQHVLGGVATRRRNRPGSARGDP
jgi:signal transduction histidine kinase